MKTIGSGAPGKSRQDWTIRLGVALLASVITATIGPFATYEAFTFFERLLYWGGLIFGLIVPAYIVRTVIYRFLSGSPLKQDLIAAGLLSVIIGPIVWAFNFYVMDFAIAMPIYVAEHIGIVALICSVPVCIRAYLRVRVSELQQHAATSEPDRAAEFTEAQTAFLKRLEPDKRGYVWRVSADDHQVEVWTDRGSSKLRLRFSDALEELTEFNGTRIHRSHWVAFSKIDAIIPDGRRHVMRLSCGTELPVSQNGLRALQDAGVAVGEASVARAS